MSENALQHVRERTVEMSGEGRSLREILAYLVREAEAMSGGDATCSIRLKPESAVGTCAAAAALTSTWSMPIVGDGGRVLGSFDTCFRESRQPRPEERKFVESLAQIARAVIER
jgi:GAF domain-containing protein